MVERASEGACCTLERDRLAVELRYVTRHCDWDPPPQIERAIIDWQIEAVAAAAANMWVPGMAGSRDPLVEDMLERFHLRHAGATVARLAQEKTALKRQVMDALACIRCYAAGTVDGGSRAQAALTALLAQQPDGEDSDVIPIFLRRAHRVAS